MHNANEIRFFIFGDSICFGQGVSISRGWVTEVAKKIDSFNMEHHHNIIVINVSRNGNTTRQALERIHYDVQSHTPQLLLVQFGLNDCNYWDTDQGLPRVSPKSFEADLEEIIDRGLTFGAKSIFLHTNHPTLCDKNKVFPKGLSYDLNNRHYNAIIRKVASNNHKDIIFNDIEHKFDEVCRDKVNKLESLLLPDGLHLSTEGHKVYLDAVWPQVKAKISQLLA